MIFLWSCEHRYLKFLNVTILWVCFLSKYAHVKCLNFQILDWLSHSPTDIESFIRPGCIVLTIYLSQAEAAWDEVSLVCVKLWILSSLFLNSINFFIILTLYLLL